MPTFTQPTTYEDVRIASVGEPSGSLAEVTAVLYEHLSDFFAYPQMYVDIDAGMADSLFAQWKEHTYLDPDALRKEDRTEWCALLPMEIADTKGIRSIPITIRNSASPEINPDSHQLLPTVAGNLFGEARYLVNRTILIVLHKLSRVLCFRAADAVYAWLLSVSPVLALETGATSVTSDGVRGVSPSEQALYSPVPGDSVVIPVHVLAPMGFVYNSVDPV